MCLNVNLAFQTEVSDNESVNQIATSTTSSAVVLNSTENHISSTIKLCRPPTTVAITVNKTSQRSTCTSIAEDSDSTNNSLASSSGIGGSRDCSGVGVEEDNSLTSFEGILLNGAPSNMDIDAQEDGSSKDSSSVISKEKPLQSMMLADLLERKVEKEPILNGVLGKNSINEKGMDLVENHIKKVLKESPTDIKMKSEIEEGNVIQTEVSEDTLIEAPRGMKRAASESDEIDVKKVKYSNGTMSPDPAVDSTTAESTVSSIKSEEQDDDKDSEKATVSSTAANLYAALAADCIEDETDLDESVNVTKEEPPPPPPTRKEEPHIFVNQITQQQQQTQTPQQPQQPPPPLQQPLQQLQQPQPQIQQPQLQLQQVQQQPPQQQHQQQLIVAGPRQIQLVQQTIQPNNQVIIPAGSIGERKAAATSAASFVTTRSRRPVAVRCFRRCSWSELRAGSTADDVGAGSGADGFGGSDNAAAGHRREDYHYFAAPSNCPADSAKNGSGHASRTTGCRHAGLASHFAESCPWEYTSTTRANVGHDPANFHNSEQFGSTNKPKHGDRDDPSDGPANACVDQRAVEGGHPHSSLHSTAHEAHDASSGGCDAWVGSETDAKSSEDCQFLYLHGAGI